MRERVAQTVLLVRAFEEVDRDGVVLSQEQRLVASRRAVMVTTHQDGSDIVSPVDCASTLPVGGPAGVEGDPQLATNKSTAIIRVWCTAWVSPIRSILGG